MSPVGFEPTISAGKRPQTYALDRAAAGTGKYWLQYLKFRYVYQNKTVYQQVVCNKTQHVMLKVRLVHLSYHRKQVYAMRNHSVRKQTSIFCVEFLIGSARTVSTETSTPCILTQ